MAEERNFRELVKTFKIEGDILAKKLNVLSAEDDNKVMEFFLHRDIENNKNTLHVSSLVDGVPIRVSIDLNEKE